MQITGIYHFNSHKCRYTKQLTAMSLALDRIMLQAATTPLIPVCAATAQSVQIDFRLAQSILDRLGYSLRDLSLEYGDVVIPSGDISHELYYSSLHNSHNLLGLVWIENDIYYVSGGGNHRHAEIAALELLDRDVVLNMAVDIELERSTMREYM